MGRPPGGAPVSGFRAPRCGDLRAADAGREVELYGWVSRRRDHGGLVFVDVRDRWGSAQVVFNPATAPEAHREAQELRAEYVVHVRGTVQRRPEGSENPNLPTGEVEVHACELEVVNASRTPPWQLDSEQEPEEAVRLKYRYLDLRRPRMQHIMQVRHRVNQLTRRYFDERDFLEVETPILTKSTPEGARDFLVPSRLHPGRFFALPQSPQQMKQLLMVAGVQRYYQIARCLRDEALRADRQPEFTQLDIEMSFNDEEDVFELTEGLIARLWKEVIGVDIAPERIERAKAVHEAKNLRFYVGEAYHLPLDRQSVDVVVSFAVFHHLELARMVPELKRVLRRPGMVFIVDIYEGFQKPSARIRTWLRMFRRDGVLLTLSTFAKMLPLYMRKKNRRHRRNDSERMKKMNTYTFQGFREQYSKHLPGCTCGEDIVPFVYCQYVIRE